LPGIVDVSWELILDTANEDGFVAGGPVAAAGQPHLLSARSLCVFRRSAAGAGETKPTAGREHSAGAAAIGQQPHYSL
jgi:hypothetical protein